MTKYQTPRAVRHGVWHLDLGLCLDFGFWALDLPARFPSAPYDFQLEDTRRSVLGPVQGYAVTLEDSFGPAFGLGYRLNRVAPDIERHVATAQGQGGAGFMDDLDFPCLLDAFDGGRGDCSPADLQLFQGQQVEVYGVPIWLPEVGPDVAGEQGPVRLQDQFLKDVGRLLVQEIA